MIQESATGTEERAGERTEFTTRTEERKENMQPVVLQDRIEEPIRTGKRTRQTPENWCDYDCTQILLKKDDQQTITDCGHNSSRGSQTQEIKIREKKKLKTEIDGAHNSKEDLQMETKGTRTPYIDLFQRPQHYCHNEKHRCNVLRNDRGFQKDDAVLSGQRERESDTDSDLSRNEIGSAIATFGIEIGSTIATSHEQKSAAYINPEPRMPKHSSDTEQIEAAAIFLALQLIATMEKEKMDHMEGAKEDELMRVLEIEADYSSDEELTKQLENELGEQTVCSYAEVLEVTEGSRLTIADLCRKRHA